MRLVQFTSLAVIAAAISPALAREAARAERTPASVEVQERLRSIEHEIRRLRVEGGDAGTIERLDAERARLTNGRQQSASRETSSATTPAAPASTHTEPATTHAELALPPACGATPTTTSFAGTFGAIPNAGPAANSPVTFTTLVSGQGAFLWDVDLNTAIAHTNPGDLEIRLTSPAGTTVAISTRNGGTADHVFNGTIWDDNTNSPVTAALFTANVVSTPLAPEGRLANFRGEDPNGTWTLAIQDMVNVNTGTLSSWSLDISTLASPPTVSSSTFSVSPALPVNNVTPTVASPLLLSGLGTYLSEIELYVEIPHVWSDDLDITLQSPLGPAVLVASDNAGSSDNVYNGSLFDADAPTPASDYPYVSFVAATPLSPEGSFDNWLGQDPNGTWQLTVADDFASADHGTLMRWDLTASTIPVPSPSAPASFAGTTGPIPDFQSFAPGVALFTANVSGVGSWLWDVDLTTEIQHTWSSDLGVTLTSPAGTVVTITTGNGGDDFDVYNGTLFDDNVNDPVTDHVYTNLVAATPLSPEGRLAAFRGENPNGTWTLTVADNDYPDPGTNALNGWSLAVSTLAVPIGETAPVPFSQSPGAVVAFGSPAVDVMPVSVPGTAITDVDLYVEISHPYPSDLDITLTSPLGTVVTVTTDNTVDGLGGNAFSASIFDVDAPSPVSDYAYVHLTPASPMSPEGSFDNFVGQNPNGNWTLTVVDDLSPDNGTFVRWDLSFRTCGAPPVVAYCFGDGSGTPCPCLPSPLVGDPDKGCPNGPFPGGGKLTASGIPSIGADSLVMTCTTINNGGGVVFQGTTDNGGGLGTAFGDGLRCAAGTVRRMRSHTVTTNTHVYPDPMFGDNAISIRGAVIAPGDRYYQGWYRSGLAHCNPTQNYNLTNGLRVTWVP